MVALRFKELPPLLDGRFHNRVVIFGERYVGPVRLEEILVNMEAWAEGFQSAASNRFTAYSCSERSRLS